MTENLELSVDQITAALEANPDLRTSVTSTLVTPDYVSAFIETDQGKSLIAPKLDSYASKAIDGWKNKNLEGIVQQKVAELHPPETPEAKQMAEMRVRLEAIEGEKNKLELRSVASSELSRVGLGPEFLDFITGDSPETIKHHANALEVHISNLVKAKADSNLADLGSKSAPSNNGGTPPGKGDKMSDYTLSELTELMATNPVKAQQIIDNG